MLLGTTNPGQGQTSGAISWPDPTRYESSIRAFEAADSVSAPPMHQLLAIGSSSIAAWHPTIARDLAPMTVIPRGFGGSVMNDVLHYVDRVVLPYRPRAILLYEGDNDISRGLSPDTIRACFDALVAKVHAQLPGTRIYVLSLKPSGARWDLWPQMQAVNRLLAIACQADHRLTFVDVAAPLIGVDARPDTLLFRSDRLHLNAAGYRVWTAMVRPVLMAGEAHPVEGSVADE